MTLEEGIRSQHVVRWIDAPASDLNAAAAAAPLDHLDGGRLTGPTCTHGFESLSWGIREKRTSVHPPIRASGGWMDCDGDRLEEKDETEH